MPSHGLRRSLVQVSDDADLHRFLERAYGVKLRISRVDDSNRDPALVHARTDAGSFAIEDVDLAGRLVAESEPLTQVAAVWPSRGTVTGRSGGLTTGADVDQVALVSQTGEPFNIQTGDVGLVSVLIDPALLASVATGIPVAHVRTSVRFHSLVPVDAAAGRIWRQTVDYVKNVLLRDEAMATPLVLGHAARLLAAVTLSTFSNTAIVDDRPQDRADTHPVLLRRAIEFMEVNASADISIGDIAEAVHITPRAVQYMFRRHLDTTPIRHLRRIRLEAAHRDLLAGDRRHTTVTAIAAKWGFAHTGRFAVQYRHAYGLSPHTTLRGA
ncbi:AraC family transcriptional regulator [Mycobacterium sp. IDR2000157661]|nr:AraC family transcriptional regulator [Mycobacterium sp. IDR2000157661]